MQSKNNNIEISIECLLPSMSHSCCFVKPQNYTAFLLCSVVYFFQSRYLNGKTDVQRCMYLYGFVSVFDALQSFYFKWEKLQNLQFSFISKQIAVLLKNTHKKKEEKSRSKKQLESAQI